MPMETVENEDNSLHGIESIDEDQDKDDDMSASSEHDMDDGQNQGNCNPYKRLVVKAVLQAMTIMNDNGASIKTFEDILSYGKAMLFSSLHSDVDVDILTALWPKTWSQVQSLLKEEGYSDPKEYYVCICRKEKVNTRNGKTTKSYHYSRNWSLMEIEQK